MSEGSLSAAIDAAGSPVSLLRNSRAPAFNFPAKPEWTNWRSEQRAWNDGCALLDQSHHMASLLLRGPGALELLKRVGTNTFKNFGVGKAKQLIMISPDGLLIGDVVLFHLEEGFFQLTGSHFKLRWLQYQAETGPEVVSCELEKNSRERTGGNPTFYRYELQGPAASEILERAAGESVGDVRFFNTVNLTIGGYPVRALRHGMAGRPGFEVFGPWKEQDAVLDVLLTAGEGLGLVRAGAKAYSTANLESGYTGALVPDIFADTPEMRAYRDWLPAGVVPGLGGSLDSSDIREYHISPYELGWGRLISFDHDFIGRKAAEQQPGGLRTKVTLVWNPEDVADAQTSLLRPGLPAKYIEFPKARYASFQVDEVLVDGTRAGLSLDCGYLSNEHAMVSIAVLDEAYTEPGTEVRLVWGEDPLTRKPTVEPHQQREIRATVAPAPYGEFARNNYRAG